MRAIPPSDDGSGLVGVTLHSCPGCDLSFADVSHRVVKGKEARVISLLKKYRVSPQMAELMRTAPARVQKEDASEEGESLVAE